MSGTFNEQVDGVAGFFDQWGECERTVMACALARKVPWPGLRLLQRAVEAALRQHADDDCLERDANDEVLLASLLPLRNDETDDDGCIRLRRLLTLLPLLRTDNTRAKDVWVSAAPALVQRCVDSPPRSSGPDLTRQLLAYLLVHPALSQHDQQVLKPWLRFLENHITSGRTSELWQPHMEPCLPVPELPIPENIWATNNTFRRTIGKNVDFRDLIEHSYNPDPLQESFSKNGRDVDISLEGDKLNFDPAISLPKSQRSNSLTPPSTNFLQMSSSAENLSDEQFVQKPRSFSLSSEHSLGHLRPISIMYGTTGSETRLDDLRSHNFGEYPGMSTVAQWLKSLRLHKYVWLFTNISYEQMMALDDEYLNKLGVTKGARHKLLLSIKKLNERESVLESIASELNTSAGGVAIARALEMLRSVMLSPMPPSSTLPSVIVKLLEQASRIVCEGGATMTRADEDDVQTDPLSLHCWLVEKALHHEAFALPSLQSALRRLRHRLPPRQFFLHVSDMPHRRHHKTRWRPNGSHSMTYSKPLQKRPWTVKTNGAPPQRGKSNSYPPYPSAPPPILPPSSVCDEYSSLDALCLQMTEQAIN